MTKVYVLYENGKWGHKCDYVFNGIKFATVMKTARLENQRVNGYFQKRSEP